MAKLMRLTCLIYLSAAFETIELIILVARLSWCIRYCITLVYILSKW